MNKINLSKQQAIRMGKLVRTLRKQSCMTQLELSQEVTGYEVSHCFVSRVERARLLSIPKERIEAMAQNLNVEPDYLIGNVYSAIEKLPYQAIDAVFSLAKGIAEGKVPVKRVRELAAMAA